MKRQLICCICVLSFSIFTVSSAKAGEWHFPLGLSYITGLGEVSDLRYDNMEALGYATTEWFDWPLGFTFQPYYEFDNGLGIGTGIGPTIFSVEGDFSFTNVPVGLDMRYMFSHPSKTSTYIRNTSLYIRAGARYNIATGDFVKSSSPGAFGAIGIEFSRMTTLGLGIELAYDASEIEFEKFEKHYLDSEGNFWDYTVSTVKIRPNAIMLSFFAIF
jgi:hypothetical protein